MVNVQLRRSEICCKSMHHSRSIPQLPPTASLLPPYPPSTQPSQANIAAISRGRSAAAALSPSSQDDPSSPRHGLLPFNHSNPAGGSLSGAAGAGGQSNGQFAVNGNDAAYHRSGGSEGAAQRSPVASLASFRSSPPDAQDRLVERVGTRSPNSEQWGRGGSSYTASAYVSADAASKGKGRLSTMDFINAGSSLRFNSSNCVFSFAYMGTIGLRPEIAAHVSCTVD